MTFRAAQPLPIEWFGGIDSSTPPNDLPPFSAVTAENCIFPESCVGSRPGFTFVTSGTANHPGIGAAAYPATSISAARVAVNAAVGVEDVVFVGFANGDVRIYTLGSATLNVGYEWRTTGTSITTVSQFYQRALGCFSTSSGYGDAARIFGFTGYAPLNPRRSVPAAPSVSVSVGTGSMTAGLHRVALTVVQKDGSESGLGTPTSVTTAAGDAIVVTWVDAGIPVYGGALSLSVWITPVGDPTAFRRIATVADTAMSVTITTSDAALVEYEQVNHHLRVRAPRDPALAIPYAGRIAYFGERHVAVGGWGSGGSQSVDLGLGAGGYVAGRPPGGWTITAGAGGYGRYPGAVIDFSGVAGTRARFENVGYVLYDLPGVAQKSTPGWTGTFGVRIKFVLRYPCASGTLRWGVKGTTGTTYQDVSVATLTPAKPYILEQVITGYFSDDLRLFFEGIGPGTAGAELEVWDISAYDVANVSHRSTVWWSRPLELSAIDGLYGPQAFGPDDGERAWLGFEWQGRFFVAKETSIWVTTKSEAEPVDWPIEKVCDLVGACGRRSFAQGADFNILVNRLGCWLFQGTSVGPDGNLANEIPTEWAAINWAHAWQIWVEVDEANKRIYVGVPTGASTYCNKMYVLDYGGGFGSATESGGRRWSVWPIEARGGAMVRRPGVSQPEVWICRNATTVSEFARLDSATPATRDWMTLEAIPWTYETGKIGAPDGALGVYRRLALNAEGIGLLNPSLVKADGTLVTLPSPTLYTPMRGTQHLLCNAKDERVGLRFTLTGTGAKAILHRVALWMRRHPFGAYRPRTP